MYKVVVFIPVSSSNKVKQAMFDAGAGKIGKYDSCSFEVLGIGQFRPLQGSKPYLGEENKVERVKELRVEIICEDKYLESVIKVMKQVHPYEMPAYDVIKLEDYT